MGTLMTLTMTLRIALLFCLFGWTKCLAIDTLSYVYDVDWGNNYLSVDVEREAVLGSDRTSYEYYVYTWPGYEVQEVIAYKNGERIRNVSFHKHLAKNTFQSQTKKWIVNYGIVKKGDTLRLEYTAFDIKLDDLPCFKMYDGSYYRKYELNFDYPSRFDLRLNVRSDNDVEPDVFEIDDGEAKVVWNELESRTYSGFRYNDAVRMWIEPTFMRGDDEHCKVSEASFVERMLDLYPDEIFEDPVVDFNFPKDRDFASWIDSVTYIHDFATNQIRYVADNRNFGGVIPSEPMAVCQRGWGDCKDKSVLCVSIAKDYGLTCYPVYVQTEFFVPANQGAHSGYFDHVLTMWVNGNDTLFADPTLSGIGIGNLSYNLHGNNGLVVHQTEYGWVDMPANNTGDSTVLELELNPHSATSNELVFRFFGFSADSRFDKIKRLDGVRLYRYVEDLLEYLAQGVDLVSVENVEMTDSTLSLTTIVDVQDFVVRINDQVYIPTIPFYTAFIDDVKSIGEREQFLLHGANITFVVKNYTSDVATDPLRVEERGKILSLENNDDGFVQSVIVPRTLEVEKPDSRWMKQVRKLQEHYTQLRQTH